MGVNFILCIILFDHCFSLFVFCVFSFPQKQTNKNGSFCIVPLDVIIHWTMTEGSILDLNCNTTGSTKIFFEG